MLAVIGVLTSVVGAYYYLRIVKVMYFDEPAGAFDRPIAARNEGRAGGRGRRDHVLLPAAGPGRRRRRRRGGLAVRQMTAASDGAAALVPACRLRDDRQHQR